MKVCVCSPTIREPVAPFFDSLEASAKLMDAAGIENVSTYEVGSAYISGARAKMVRRAMIWDADVVVFLDDDLSWDPEDLLTLINTPGDVVGGTYRFKTDDVKYMGIAMTQGEGGQVIERGDGPIKACTLPAGFLKVTKEGLNRFMEGYPELVILNFDDKDDMQKGFKSPDLFNHGAHLGVWWGEDYAFCRNWLSLGEDVWLVPNLNITHHLRMRDGTLKSFPGNFHEALLRCPGGRLDIKPVPKYMEAA